MSERVGVNMSEWTHECKCADACDFARQSEWVSKRVCDECVSE